MAPLAAATAARRYAMVQGQRLEDSEFLCGPVELWIGRWPLLKWWFNGVKNGGKP